jgi:uncharacterized protein YjeT (DUF2065 family)
MGVGLPYPDSFILLIMGIVFTAVGAGVLGWSRWAERRYNDALMTRTDVREFLESTPERSGYGALRMGGLISIIVGAVLLGITAFLHFGG